ncbi:MAG: hypothetical protein DRQ01_02275 [Ignavibacteriae bacterium]|nr:MAG: hypothetical protein DRQ01_02275 [Ignavibacteriota bacterium]
MNLLNKIYFTFLFLFLFTPEYYSQDCAAELIIESDIEGVEIFINNISVGVGSTFKIKLENGDYVVTVNENSDRWDARSFTDTLHITDCNDNKLNYYFRSEVLLDTEPQNVYVFNKDSLIGFTPLLIPVDLEKVYLQKPGYLAKEILHDDIYSLQKITLDYIGEETKESFFEGTLFKVLVGSAVLLGASAAYFKLEADKKFDEYLITGDKKLLDQTNRFDVISGVTFVAMQINFGFIMYLFLID